MFFTTCLPSSAAPSTLRRRRFAAHQPPSVPRGFARFVDAVHGIGDSLDRLLYTDRDLLVTLMSRTIACGLEIESRVALPDHHLWSSHPGCRPDDARGLTTS